MTDEQIREWVVELQNAIVTGEADQHTLESAARALIASVRAEAAEEFCKLFDGYYYGPFEHPSSTIRRALAKERKVEE